MKLARAEFERRWKANNLRVSLIGMSNIGKSWLAARLAAALGIAVVEVDGFIRARLDKGSMADFAKWLGHPNTSGYAEREARSLALEDAATLDALDTLEAPAILDTTGSVIYCPKACARLPRETFTVYLRASAAQRKTLEALYFSHPKPLNWAGHFEAREGELFGDAVARCYPALLDSRDQDYLALADHVVDAETIYATEDAKALFALLKPAPESS